MYAWLQVQEGVALKASDLIRFVLQTDTRSKERQAARITRLKVTLPPPPHHTLTTISLSAQRYKKLLSRLSVCLSVTYEVEEAWSYSSCFDCQEHIHRVYDWESKIQNSWKVHCLKADGRSAHVKLCTRVVKTVMMITPQ